MMKNSVKKIIDVYYNSGTCSTKDFNFKNNKELKIALGIFSCWIIKRKKDVESMLKTKKWIRIDILNEETLFSTLLI